jgi:methylglutaconyl-CoA hydratase
VSIINWKIQNSIGILQIYSPETRNAISREILRELNTTVQVIQDQKSIDRPRVLILQGVQGVAFSAGADLKERATMAEDEVWEFLDRFREFLNLLENLPIPTIASIGGVALGGGLEIALACDLRVGSESAILGLPEAKLGIIPGAGGTQRLSRLIGSSKAKEMIFTGRRMSGQDALSWGILNRVSPLNRLDETVFDLAQEIAESAPVSLRAAKKAIQEGMDLPLEKGFDLERDCYKSTISTKDRNEALAAFREKRKPIFIGE